MIIKDSVKQLKWEETKCGNLIRLMASPNFLNIKYQISEAIGFSGDPYYFLEVLNKEGKILIANPKAKNARFKTIEEAQVIALKKFKKTLKEKAGKALKKIPELRKELIEKKLFIRAVVEKQ